MSEGVPLPYCASCQRRGRASLMLQDTLYPTVFRCPVCGAQRRVAAPAANTVEQRVRALEALLSSRFSVRFGLPRYTPASLLFAEFLGVYLTQRGNAGGPIELKVLAGESSIPERTCYRLLREHQAAAVLAGPRPEADDGGEKEGKS